MAVIDFFDRGWRINPQGAAYCSEDSRWTFDQAGRLTCRIANALIAAGVATGTNAAVLAPNDPLAWICVLGIWRAGCAWVPINPAQPADQNAALLRRLDVEVLFYAPKVADQVEQLRPLLRGVTTWVALGGGTEDAGLSDWVSGFADTRPELRYGMDDVIAVAPTGGTTGVPKGVMNTHRSLSTMIIHQMLALTYPADAPIVNLAAAPMTHTAGLFSLQTTARGGTTVVINGARADAILDAIEAYQVTELFLPPTVVYRILDRLDHRAADTSSLRYLMYAAAPMSLQKLRQGIDRLGPVFIECYGQMEAPAAISFLRPDEHFVDGVVAPDSRLSSCGRPYPLISVAILDPESGIELGTGVTGEVCVRGDLVMKGYYKDPERTAQTVVDGWLRTGDLGSIDEHGYLHLTDRKKDMIISGGFNIYPAEVEQVIWSHPAVQDCAVVGAPDPDWGEVVTGVVELNLGAAADEAEIIALCRERLGSVKSPKRIVFVDRLPRSANGKVLKKDIRAQFWIGRSTKT